MGRKPINIERYKHSLNLPGEDDIEYQWFEGDKDDPLVSLKDAVEAGFTPLTVREIIERRVKIVDSLKGDSTQEVREKTPTIHAWYGFDILSADIALPQTFPECLNFYSGFFKDSKRTQELIAIEKISSEDQDKLIDMSIFTGNGFPIPVRNIGSREKEINSKCGQLARYSDWDIDGEKKPQEHFIQLCLKSNGKYRGNIPRLVQRYFKHVQRYQKVRRERKSIPRFPSVPNTIISSHTADKLSCGSAFTPLYCLSVLRADKNGGIELSPGRMTQTIGYRTERTERPKLDDGVLEELLQSIFDGRSFENPYDGGKRYALKR